MDQIEESKREIGELKKMPKGDLEKEKSLMDQIEESKREIEELKKIPKGDPEKEK